MHANLFPFPFGGEDAQMGVGKKDMVGLQQAGRWLSLLLWYGADTLVYRLPLRYFALDTSKRLS